MLERKKDKRRAVQFPAWLKLNHSQLAGVQAPNSLRIATFRHEGKLRGLLQARKPISCCGRRLGLRLCSLLNISLGTLRGSLKHCLSKRPPPPNIPPTSRHWSDLIRPWFESVDSRSSVYPAAERVFDSSRYVRFRKSSHSCIKN